MKIVFGIISYGAQIALAERALCICPARAFLRGGVLSI